MYIRVKRSKTTYFIQCEPTETSLDIKQKLHDLIDRPVNDQRLILVSTGEVLEDSKALADQKVENDAVVALAFRKGESLILLFFSSHLTFKLMFGMSILFAGLLAVDMDLSYACFGPA
ncbi:hypothetical protein C1H46_034238 [Malus baccata]|uniref:Ubiquitin-like domain-containing protein n=1 Tax=Malus baccata TaxID=106549 RepID=A0A540L117_MALBA|nr:hypothetical protein C1H46_034238 [Malus baccata]